MYDIFFTIHDNEAAKAYIKSRFPLAKFCIVDENNSVRDAIFSAQKRSTTRMFWLVDLGYEVHESFDLEYLVSEWDQHYVHVFKEDRTNEHKGIYLIPKTYPITKKEAEYVFFINKKEVDINASRPTPFDIVFISYAEPNADENYKLLTGRFPHAKRIHGVKGIHNAHKEAAKIVETPMFWVVDGDAQIVDDFCFDYQVPVWRFDVVHVCRSVNPINGLEYGYGGVKLLPTQLTRNVDTTTVDMTTNISSKFMALPVVSNISVFNTDEFNTWKSAFRECVKLSSKIIPGQYDGETTHRLNVWCTVGKDNPYGAFAIAGAISGKEYGFKYKNNQTMLSKINDWAWLENEFQIRKQHIL